MIAVIPIKVRRLTLQWETVSAFFGVVALAAEVVVPSFFLPNCCCLTALISQQPFEHALLSNLICILCARNLELDDVIMTRSVSVDRHCPQIRHKFHLARPQLTETTNFLATYSVIQIIPASLFVFHKSSDRARFSDHV